MVAQKASRDTLRRFAHQHKLLKEFDSFTRVLPMPPEFTGFLYAVRRIHNLLRDTAMPAHWQQLQPFASWTTLFDLILANAKTLANGEEETIGAGFWNRVNKRSIVQGEMEKYPLLAMICTEHESKHETGHPEEKPDLLYGCLQLQLLHAHWLKILSFQQENPSRQAIKEYRQPKRGRRHKNNLKLSIDAGRAVRQFQKKENQQWLEELDPLALPGDFRSKLCTAAPAADSRKPTHTKLRRYCARGHEPGKGGKGGARVPSAERYLYLLDYRGHRYGVLDEAGNGGGEDGGGEDDGGNQNPPTEHLARTHVNGEQGPPSKDGKKGKHLTTREILDLGLDPLELSDGEIDVLLTPPAGGDRREGTEAARAQIRALEIDRRLYPWNSQAIRLEEFQENIIPVLQKALDDRQELEQRPASPKAKAQATDAVAAAAAIAIAAETGRTLEQVLQLRIEENPSAAFCFCRPTKEGGCGLWKWDAVSPRYKREIAGSEKDVKRLRELAADRAEFLIYPASQLVTDLILQFANDKPPKRNVLFRYQRQGFAKKVRKWLQGRCHTSRFTLPRISRLMWDLMHRNTGGELASVCLTLGLPHPLAQVELFYAVLHEAEASSIFRQSTAMLWGQSPVSGPPLRQARDPQFGALTGCRAFPRLEEVQSIMGTFRKQSTTFFSRPVAKFTLQHRDLLNGAVMYLLWHQFFSFGTRAICDAYQTIDGFLNPVGVGILSDKDFSSGYKTRIVVANERLRQHMAAVERRLAMLHKQLPEAPSEDVGPVWLLDAQNGPVKPSPSAIQEILRSAPYNFPFPVNTPRKVMRYLLRKSGMSHSHAEAYMGHWWHGREPFSPFSSFHFGAFVEDLTHRMRRILQNQLGIRKRSIPRP